MAISKINLWNHSKLFGSIQGYLIDPHLFLLFMTDIKIWEIFRWCFTFMAIWRTKVFFLFLFGYLTHRLVTPDNYQEHRRGGNWHLRGVWSSQGIGLMVTFMITFNIMHFLITVFVGQIKVCRKYGNATNALHLCNGLAQLLKITNTKKQTPYLLHTSLLLNNFNTHSLSLSYSTPWCWSIRNLRK